MEYQRYTLTQRLQHIILAVCFILLVVTGLPLKYRETWGKTWLEVMGFMISRSVHKWAAIALIALGVAHVIYYIFIDRGPKRVMFYLKDGRDFIQKVKFRFGMTTELPKYDRFAYWEKFDYWGALWGFVIMIGSGLIIWFKEEFAFLPLWATEAARIAHREEAMLATVFVVVFHMLHAHLRRGVFPIDPVFITGKMTEERWKEDHPLEYERVKKGVM